MPADAARTPMTGPAHTASDTTPIDIATMRETAGRLLPPDVAAPAAGEVETLTGLLRGHMQLIVPEIERAAAKLPRDDVPRYCALACVGEARGKLSAVRQRSGYDALVYARKLARSLLALCDHYDNLTGVRMCLACDQPIRDGETAVPYDQISPTGGAAHSGQVHEGCARTGRRR